MATSLNASLNVSLNPQSLNASTKQISQALGRITGQASEFQKSLDASTARVFAFGATTAVLNGVTQSFKKLVATTIEVEKRLIEINSIFQATDVQFNKFRNSIFQVAKETGQAFNTVAEGAAELARQGLSAEETAKRLKASLVLTRISGLDAEKSVKALTAAINGFTSAGLNANQIVNKMVAVDTAFAVSAQDLAEAFSRAGSTAEDAGVSFDQLLGLVTAVEQKTARGGAVIGNAFKSIFTRLQRGTTIEELKELGVQIDASMSGVQKLSALSNAIENIADPTVVSKIKELAGGVFQINVVSAALKDLSSDTSIFQKAATTASKATNEAFEKNEALNKSLASQINALIQGVTSLAEKIGKLTFGPLLENLVGIATKFTEFLDKALDPEKGNIFIKGIFKAIGAFMGGPAVVLVTAAFAKIAKLVAKFAIEGLRSLFAMGTQAEKIKNIEAGLVGLLQKDESLRNMILSTTATQAQKEQAVLAAIQRENQLLTTQAALMRQIATSAAARGVGGFNAGTGLFGGKKGKPFAVGGRVTGGSGTKDDVPAMLTAGEFVMQKSAVNKFGQPFMEDINQGRLGFNRGGFVPNYAKFKTLRTSDSTKNIEKGLKDGKYDKDDAIAAKALIAKRKKGQKGATKPIDVLASSFAFIVPSPSAGSSANAYKKGQAKVGGVLYPYRITDSIRTFAPSIKGLDAKAEPYDSKIERKISSGVTDAATQYANLISVPKGVNKADRSDIKRRLGQGGQRGAFGAIRGAVGAAFEAAVFSALGLEEFRAAKGGADWDVRNLSRVGNGELAQLLGTGSMAHGDMKVGSSPDTVASFVGKILRHVDRYKPEMERVRKEKEAAKTKRAKGGIIPNYAMGRRMPDSKIRVHRDMMTGEPLAVTNIDDEPRGLRDAVARERAGMPMPMMGAKGGFVPNYRFGGVKKLFGIGSKRTGKKQRGGSGDVEKAEGGMGNLVTNLFLLSTVLGTGSAAVEQNTSSLDAEREERIANAHATEKEIGARMKLIASIEADIAARKGSQGGGGGLGGMLTFDNALNALMIGSIGGPLLKKLGGSKVGKGIGSLIGGGVGSTAGAMGRRMPTFAAAGRGVGGFLGGSSKSGIGRFTKMQAAQRMTGEGRFARAQGLGKQVSGMARGAGVVGTAIASIELLPKLFGEELTKHEKKVAAGRAAGGVAGGILGAAGAGAAAGTLVGGPLGTVAGAIVGLIGGSIGAMLGSKAGGAATEAALGPDDEGGISEEDRRRLQEIKMMQGAVQRAGTIGFDQETFGARVEAGASRIFEQAGGLKDQAAGEKAVNEALENYASSRQGYADALDEYLSYEGDDQEKQAALFKKSNAAREKLVKAAMHLTQATHRTAEEREENDRRFDELSAERNSLIEQSNANQEKLNKALLETEVALLEHKNNMAARLAMGGNLQGPFGAAVQDANQFGADMGEINQAREVKNQAQRNLDAFLRANKGQENTEDFQLRLGPFQEAVTKAGIDFKAKVGDSATRLQNLLGSLRKQQEDLKTKRADIKAQEDQNKIDFGGKFQGTGFNKVDPTFLKAQMDELQKTFLDPKATEHDKAKLLENFNPQDLGSVTEVIKGLGSPELVEAINSFKSAGVNKMKDAGFSDEQIKNLQKETGVLKTDELASVDEEIEAVKARILGAEKAFGELEKNTDTASIAKEMKDLKAAMEAAAGSFDGVTSYIDAQVDAAKEVTKVVQGNNEIVKEARKIQETLAKDLEDVQKELGQMRRNP